MKGLPLLLVLLLAMAGCAGTDKPTTSTTKATSHAPAVIEPWTPLACDSGNVTTTARNAQLVAGLRGTEDDIAANIALALEDKVTGPAETFEDTMYMRWPTQYGYVSVQTGDGKSTAAAAGPNGTFTGANYHRDSAAIGEPELLQAAKSLGADPSTLKSASSPTVQVWQEWSGVRLYWQAVGVAGASVRPDGAGSTVSLGPFYDFLEDAPHVANAQAISSGQAFLRCFLDAQGRTEEKGYLLNTTTVQGVAVVNGTLTDLINVHYRTPESSPCGHWDVRWVFVDVVTGAVRYNMLAPCL